MTSFNDKKSVLIGRTTKIMSEMFSYLGNGDYRSELRVERGAEISCRATELDIAITQLQDAKNENDLNAAMNTVRTSLLAGLKANENLSTKYSKTHGSWRLARLAGNGLFSSAQAKLTGSRAGRVYERGLSAMDELTRELSLGHVAAVQPPIAFKVEPNVPNRENVTATLNEIVGKLKSYLNNYRYQVLTKEEAEGFYRSDWNYACTIDKKGRYIVIKELDTKNSQLSVERIANIHCISEELGDILKSDVLKQNDPAVFATTMTRVCELLRAGGIENTTQTFAHGKDHRSREHNRTNGDGKCMSWLNKTWKQSRAGKALSESMAELNRFSKRFGVSLEAPPAYQAPASTPSAPIAAGPR